MNNAAMLLLTVFALTSPTFADISTERDFRQAQQDRDKAAAAAMESINRRYQFTLEALLRRATMANELELAVQIKEAIANANIPIQRTAEPTEKADLKRLLISGSWSWWWESYDFEGDSRAIVQFNKDGSCKAIPKTTLLNKWEVIGPTQLKVSIDKDKYWVFDIDLNKKEGRTNLEASSLKEKKSIRYFGK